MIFLFVLSALAGCADKSKVGGYKTNVEDYKNSKVGIMTGSYQSTIIGDFFPDATILEYNNPADMLYALTENKIDITMIDASSYTCALWEGLQISRLDEVAETSSYGIIFPKEQQQELRLQVNAFLAKIKENGTYDKLNEKWFGNKEPTEFLDPEALTGTNGTLRVIVNNELKPFGYIKNGKLVGYDVEILTLFAEEYGYRLDITSVPFQSLLAGVSGGAYQLGISGLTITEERKETFDFSDTYHNEDIIYVVAGDGDGLNAFRRAELGAVTGSLYGGYCRELFPNAHISEFNNFSDVLMALRQGKVDGTMLDRPNFNAVKRTDSKLSAVNVPQYSVEIGFGFQKTEEGYALQAQMNSFLDKLRADGRLDSMLDKWYGETEPSVSIPLEGLKENPKTLRVSIDTTRKPFVYMYEGKPVGFEIEALYLFCKEYGYNVEIEDVSFASGLAGLAGEKYDLVCGGLYMTPERKESVNFSDPYMVADVVMATYEKSGVGNVFASIGESFEKTFIRESRWKLIVKGILTTLLISVCAVLGGTVLGFLLYLAARSKNRVLSSVTRVFTKIYSKLITGTPTLVVLMLLFYVVFGRSDLGGTVVAIIGFILTFGSFVYGQLSLTVEAVDKGQTEAAYALGYSRNRTFFRIVLPQAMKMFLPVYSAEIVGLIKATSVVGYIAVNDLTKMGDIIRGNTYEAFFPLIAVAVIYFMITWGAAALLGIMQRKFEPKRRKKKNILKGVAR